MENLQKSVLEFQTAVGQNVKSSPDFPNSADTKLVIKLITDELQELVDGIEAKDLTEIADGFGDLLVTVLGGANFFGMDMEPIFYEIHRSNMTKTIDGWKDEETGKWQKGPSFEKPDINKILEAQK